MGNGAHVGGGARIGQEQRLRERLLVEGRGQLLVDEELDALEGGALRQVDLGACAQALVEAAAAAGLDEPDAEAVLARVHQHLVLGDDEPVVVAGLDAQDAQPRERPEVDLDVVGRAVLAHDALLVEVEGDRLDLVSRGQGVEAHEARVQLARRGDDAHRGLLGADRLGRLLEQAHRLAVAVVGDLGEVLQARHVERLLVHGEGARREVLELEDDGVRAGSEVALERHRHAALRRLLLGETELVAERLEELAVLYHLSRDLEVVRAEAGEVLDGSLVERYAQHGLHHRATLDPAEELEVDLGLEGVRLVRDVGGEGPEGGDPLLAARSRLGEHALQRLVVARPHVVQPVEDAVEAPAVQAASRVADHVGDVAGAGAPDRGASEPSGTQEDEHEVQVEHVAAVVLPDLDRCARRRAADLERGRGRAVHEQDARAVVGEVPVVRDGLEDALFPALLQLVAPGLGIGVAHLPELADEGVAMVVALEGEEGAALGLRDEGIDLAQPPQVPALGLVFSLELGRRCGVARAGRHLGLGSRVARRLERQLSERGRARHAQAQEQQGRWGQAPAKARHLVCSTAEAMKDRTSARAALDPGPRVY